MKRKFIRPLWQRTVAMTMAMLLLAGTAYSEGLTSRASATDLWEETAESSDQGTHDLESSLFDHDSDSGLGLSGDEDAADKSDDLFGSETEDLFESESHEEDGLFAEEESDPVVSASAEDITVNITGSSEIMDEIETVSIQEMGEDRVAAWQEMFDTMNEGDTRCIVSAVYDITLTDRQGNETEPKGDVTVSLTGEKVAEGITDRMDLQVYHDIEKGSDKPVSEDAVEEMAVYEEGMDTVVFDTDSFSEYALVLRPGKSTQREMVFSQNEYLELDKHIKETGGQPVNGQKTYDIYLEQAYYKPESDIKMPNAPLRSDFFLIMDHSASMSDYPVVRLNQAVDKLLKEIQARNNMRVKRAAEGKYKNINPSSVVAEFLPDGRYKLKDPATVKHAMRDHLIYLTGAITYNNHVDVKVNPRDKVAIYTDADRQGLLDISSWVAADMPVENIDETRKSMYGSGKLLGWPDYGAGDVCLQNMTRTDLATKHVRDWIMNNLGAYTVTAPDGKDYCTARVILATDGAPAGYGNPDGYFENLDPYDYINGGNGRGAYMFRDVCPLNANDALRDINDIKKQHGARVYVSYVNVNSDPNAGTILSNLEKKWGNKNVPLNVVWEAIADRPGQPSLTATFMLLYSQCATNSRYNVNIEGSEINSFKADSNSVGYKSSHFKYHENADDIPKIEEFVEHDDQVSQQDALNGSGYASVSSYVLDEITDPFEIRSIIGIKVYAVPRIPTKLDENTRIPRNMVTGRDGKQRVRKEDFRWGDITQENERVDVTNEVTIEVVGNRVKISGYDYEANAVSDYDKDQFGQWTIPAWGDPTVYKTGDYGYKLVVVIPINAKFSFGGNGIKTNNTDISGFYPSVPTRKGLPKWEDNTQLNSEENAYIKLYPEVKVDLEVSYDIVSDDAIIYAPQTQKLHDLVTNSNNSIWFSDKGYHDAQTDWNTAKAAFDNAEKALKDSNNHPPRDATQYDAWIADNRDKANAKNAAAAELQKAQAALDKVHAYIPDGLNNAFVDIKYELRDPKGTTVGTLTIPHGKAYFTNDQGEGNIDWVFKEGANAQIKHSGIYTVKATVTPVDTIGSPSWHVYTDADSKPIQDMLKYKSTSYSPTGSSAVGPHRAITKTAEATAKIFRLKIVAKDSRQGRNELIDFDGFNVELKNHNVSDYGEHIVSYEWVCIDSKFTSNSDDEPGSDSDDININKVGSGGVNFRATVSQKALNDRLVTDDGIVKKITAPDGKYVPANVLLKRRIGDLNKGASATPKIEPAVMSDSDNKYGPGRHSVIWEHECGVMDDDVCNQNDFVHAHKYDGAEAKEDDPGKVRFLVHVVDNPNVVPSKKTTTPAISRREDIKWEVTAVNDDRTKNPNNRDSEFSLWDVLPYKEDGRHDPFTTREGSKTETDLFYKTVQVDYSKSAKAQAYLESGKGVFYYATGIGPRGAYDEAMYDSKAINAVRWTPVEGTSVGNKPNVYSYVVPPDATAIRVDTLLGWEEGIKISMTANVKDFDLQEIGDYYHNQARTYNGKFGYSSNVVSTEVTELFMAGTVWVDEDKNGIMTAEEPRKDGIKVTLYQEYNPKNPLDEANSRTIKDIQLVPGTIKDIQLVPAYDANGNKYPSVYTNESGTFVFDDMQPGVYYVVADHIPDEYEITDWKVGENDAAKRTLDSEAETKFVKNEPKYADDGNTAWIKQINMDQPKVAQNIGLKNIRGSVRVGKTLDEIYFPSNMTDEERAVYNVPFVFTLKHTGEGRTYTKQVFLNEDNMRSIGGQPQVWAEFTDLPLGTYELTETHDAQYKILDMKGNSNRVRFDAGRQKATIEIRHDEYEYTVVVKNGLDREPPGGDENGVVNRVNMRIPVKLDIIYSGPRVISNRALTEYIFRESDFKPNNGKEGDIIVTYDDGSTISLSEKTLKFTDIALTPSTVTNRMNTTGGKMYTITGYYSERGHLVTDSFGVGVDLKPVHKFGITFHANGGRFTDTPPGTPSDRNPVNFIWDDQQQKNLVSSGTYKDVSNGGLVARGRGYIFAGWNTRSDGTGEHYGTLGPVNAGVVEDSGDALEKLKDLGIDRTYNGGDLYANWKVKVTFDANGGSVTGTIPTIEQGANNSYVVILSSLHSQVPADLSASKPGEWNVNNTGIKAGYQFVEWNTDPKGNGQSLADYNDNGGVQGPVTFYAIYYQSDYGYTGKVQTFRAPVTGWYECRLWGAKGGDDRFRGGNGGYTYGEIELREGQEIYVYVGNRGETSTSGTGAGYNGGGVSGLAGESGSGGGATDIRTVPGNWDNIDSLRSRILVAGGGGGGGFFSGGGVGGGSRGGSGERGGVGEIVDVNQPWNSHPKDPDAAGNGGFAGGTQDPPGPQTYPVGALGVGASARNDGGGGGGGYYGGGASGSGNGPCDPTTDFGGGGGSSYVGTRAEQDLGIKVKKAITFAGNQNMPTPFDEGTPMPGNAGPCYARIILKNQTGQGN